MLMTTAPIIIDIFLCNLNNKTGGESKNATIKAEVLLLKKLKNMTFISRKSLDDKKKRIPLKFIKSI